MKPRRMVRSAYNDRAALLVVLILLGVVALAVLANIALVAAGAPPNPGPPPIRHTVVITHL